VIPSPTAHTGVKHALVMEVKVGEDGLSGKVRFLHTSSSSLDFGMMIGLEGANSSTGMQLLSSTSLTGVLVGVITYIGII